jgi:hypothetical protein
VQFPRKPKRRAQGALWRAPRIVVRRGAHRTRIIERLPHAAERITDVPRATQRPQAVVAVHIVGGAIAEHLAQRGGEILRIGRRAVADQHAIAIIGVTGAGLGDEAIERVVAAGAGPVAQQVARRVVKKTKSNSRSFGEILWAHDYLALRQFLM